MADFIWGDAQVTYPDLVGTAQLDERKTAPPVERAVGLDPEQWTVIGLDIGGGERAHELRVVAVAADDMPDGGDVFPRIAEANGGEVPVTEFLIHDVDPYEVLRAITHQFELRLRVRSAADLRFRVVRQADVPEQID